MNPPELASRPDGQADRRRECRYLVVDERAWLGWWEGREFRTFPARVLNLSLGGALLSAETPPPHGHRLWLCPPSANPADWIEATLVESRKRLFGPSQVRLAFGSPFPYERFKDMVFGPDALRGNDPAPSLPIDSPDRDWW
jgi:hypothetical protein